MFNTLKIVRIVYLNYCKSMKRFYDEMKRNESIYMYMYHVHIYSIYMYTNTSEFIYIDDVLELW